MKEEDTDRGSGPEEVPTEDSADESSGITIQSEQVQSAEELAGHLDWMFEVGEPL